MHLNYGAATPGRWLIGLLALFQGQKLLFDCQQSLFEKCIFSLTVPDEKPGSRRSTTEHIETHALLFAPIQVPASVRAAGTGNSWLAGWSYWHEVTMSWHVEHGWPPSHYQDERY